MYLKVIPLFPIYHLVPVLLFLTRIHLLLRLNIICIRLLNEFSDPACVLIQVFSVGFNTALTMVFLLAMAYSFL